MKDEQAVRAAERESVDDALMIVESYGPWGADLNDAHRRQIVLADEVLRLRKLYEMAVRGRAEMRTAVRDTFAECRAEVAAWPKAMREAAEQTSVLRPPVPASVTDCRSEEGITVGLIDGLIATARVLSRRDMSPSPVREALSDLQQDEDVARILRA